ncbi:hypothetical protein GGI43DRAFT_34151 [Trichoderma evansii]
MPMPGLLPKALTSTSFSLAQQPCFPTPLFLHPCWDEFLLGYRRRTSAVRIRARKAQKTSPCTAILRPLHSHPAYRRLDPSIQQPVRHATHQVPRTLMVCLYQPGPWNPRQWGPENRVPQITRREWIHSRLSLLEDRRLCWDLGRGSSGAMLSQAKSSFTAQSRLAVPCRAAPHSVTGNYL